MLSFLLCPAALASLSFSRDGQKAVIPFQQKMDLTGEMTLEVWIKPDPACKTRFFNYVISRNNGRIGYGICIQGKGRKTPNIGKVEIPLGQWTHLAFSYGARCKKLYVNGELADVVPGDARREAGPLPIYIGNSRFKGFPGNQPTQFFGEIAEVRIWSVALDQDQIRSRMHRFLNRRQPHLLAYFPLIEKQGTLVHDVTGNLINGHLGDDYLPDDNDPEWSTDEPPLEGRKPRVI